MNYKRIAHMNLYVGNVNDIYVFKSYSTVVAMYDKANKVLYKSNVYYSVTTSQHLSYIEGYINNNIHRDSKTIYTDFVTIYSSEKQLYNIISDRLENKDCKFSCISKFKKNNIVITSKPRYLSSKMFSFVKVEDIFDLTEDNKLIPRTCIVEYKDCSYTLQYDKLKLLTEQGGL